MFTYIIQALLQRAIAGIWASGAEGLGNPFTAPTFLAQIASMIALITSTFAGFKLAEGGIVRRPIHALVGEAGPEAVIPLNRYPMGVKNFNFTIQGNFLASPSEARNWAREIVKYIQEEIDR